MKTNLCMHFPTHQFCQECIFVCWFLIIFWAFIFCIQKSKESTALKKMNVLDLLYIKNIILDKTDNNDCIKSFTFLSQDNVSF